MTNDALDFDLSTLLEVLTDAALVMPQRDRDRILSFRAAAMSRHAQLDSLSQAVMAHELADLVVEMITSLLTATRRLSLARLIGFDPLRSWRSRVDSFAIDWELDWTR